MRRSALSTYLLAGGVVIALIGYTIVLMFALNLGDTEVPTRTYTVPLRLLIVGCLALAFLKAMRIPRHPSVPFFLSFSSFYFVRIRVESMKGSGDLYLAPEQFFAYFLSFVFLPFILISATRMDHRIHQLAPRWIFATSVVFVGLTVLFYREYLGQVSRLSLAMAQGDGYISPLALSYVSALVLAMIVVFWLHNKKTLRQRVYLSVLIVLLLIPFFLGASRGAVVALAVVGGFFIVVQRGLKYRIQLLLGSVLVLAVALYAQEYLGTGVFDRMANLLRDIETGSATAVRLVMWRDGWEQFLEAPFFGNSLQLETFRFHPHNMFIEVFIATGVIGMVAFIGFLVGVFWSAVTIVRDWPNQAWVVVVFLIGFVNNVFSGSISAAATMAIGAGLIVSTSAEMRRGAKPVLLRKSRRVLKAYSHWGRTRGSKENAHEG